MFSTIDYSINEGIATITFNRPDKLNALNSCLLNELLSVLEEIQYSSDVRIAILTGTGKGFMAGADIEEYSMQNSRDFEVFQEKSRRMYSLIENNEKPIIAAVNGYALGGGFEIVLCCDLVIASATAKMGLPEINLALIPGGGGTQRLPQKVGINRANELLLTGRRVDAEELYRWGIINQVVEPSILLDSAYKLAKEVADKNFNCIKSLKRLVKMGDGRNTRDGLNYEAETVNYLFNSDEAKKQVRVFVEKKPIK